MTRARRTPRPARAARTATALAVVLGASGLLHLAVPATYDAVVPRSLPGRPRPWTLASGVAELVVAAALAVPGTRRTGGALAAALFVAVFPANVSMALRALRSDRAGTRRRVVTVARLPLQVPLVTAALGVRRGS
ncbi:DoxX family protein [Frigoribacterium salinisoli]